MELPGIFLTYAKRFAEHGFRLFLIGGTTRDLLLGLNPADLDFVTDATPKEMEEFLPKLDMTFARFGSVKIKKEDIDITTFRIEGEYKDFRHPSSISFTRDPSLDSVRRDFTINALYMDETGKVYDFHDGLNDLKNKLIRFIGNPDKRIQEDPLRILRAERFAHRLGFALEQSTLEAMERNREYLKKLNPDKVKMEKEKE